MSHAQQRLSIHLRDMSQPIVDAWRQVGFDPAVFTISQGDIFLAGRHDAIVAAGNSRGIMDGGLDLVYRNHFGMQVQTCARGQIENEWRGLLPVGAAITVPTHSEAIPLMIYAPTMECPMDVSETWNAYLAFGAALREAIRLGARSVLCPGLATLTGRMVPLRAAAQMRLAWLETLAVAKP